MKIIANKHIKIKTTKINILKIGNTLYLNAVSKFSALNDLLLIINSTELINPIAK
jgi:hypothetical protein